MPKRHGYVYERIMAPSNCIQAAGNCGLKKKKASRNSSLAYEISSNPYYYGYNAFIFLKNRSEGIEPMFHPRTPDHFFIEEGYKKKQREIFAPKLLYDQIIHWAIIQVIGPMLEKSFYQYSCGSIPGRGPTMVKKYLEKSLKTDMKNNFHVRTEYKYCLKLDIHHYFQSIDRNIMMSKLEKHFKDKKFLDLMREIIFAPDTGNGLPIGFYTSQWLANLYLDDFDHWLKDLLSKEFKHNIYIRYVDDIVIIASNKRKLKDILEKIRIYLKNTLHLALKYQTPDQIFDIGKRPIDFVGYRFEYDKTTVRNAIFKRAIDLEKDTQNKKYNIKNLSGIISYNGWLDSSNCYKEKNRLYSHSTKYYKFHLKKITNSAAYRHDYNKIMANCELRNKLIEQQANEYNTSHIITLRKVVKNGDTTGIISTDCIEIDMDKMSKYDSIANFYHNRS